MATHREQCAQAAGNEARTYTLLTLCRLSEGYPFLARLRALSANGALLYKPQRKDVSHVFTITISPGSLSQGWWDCGVTEQKSGRRLPFEPNLQRKSLVRCFFVVKEAKIPVRFTAEINPSKRKSRKNTILPFLTVFLNHFSVLMLPRLLYFESGKHARFPRLSTGTQT